MGIASAIWYGGITLLGAMLGAEWERILAVMAGINRTLAIVAVVGAAIAGVWLWLNRRRRRRERVWHATRDALRPAAPSFMAGTEVAEGSAREAAALLVVELAYADPVLTPHDREEVAEHLRGRWGLGAEAHPPAPPPEHERRSRFAGYATRVRERFGRSQRLELVERMWLAAFSDGSAIGAHEDRLMSTAAELLGLDRTELAEVRRRLRLKEGRR
jgi:uncharacterized tellurite resistance protein B-like protein